MVFPKRDYSKRWCLSFEWSGDPTTPALAEAATNLRKRASVGRRAGRPKGFVGYSNTDHGARCHAVGEPVPTKVGITDRSLNMSARSAPSCNSS